MPSLKEAGGKAQSEEVYITLITTLSGLQLRDEN